jgi:subtilisin family serine protease
MMIRPVSRDSRIGFVVAVAVIVLVAALVGPVAGRPAPETRHDDRAQFVDGSILVSFKSHAGDHARSAALRGVSGRSERSLRHLGVEVVKVPPGTAAAAVDKLRANPSVRYAEPEGLAYDSDTIPNDPYFPWSGTSVLSGGQWGDKLTQAPKAWDLTTGSSSVIVAIVDSGIDDAHPDLSGQLVAGTSVIGGSTIDTHGHGEYVAGTVGAKGNNLIGPAGYCWKCKLMPVKISNDGTASYGAMASAITWAADHGARVINVSYAGTSSSSTLDAAVSYATNHGAVVVAAAGNSGCNCISYPAASPGAIGVAASDQHDNLMTYSNFGSWVHVAAPTGDITTWLTDPKTGAPYGYGPVGGTSSSAPVVSGVIALMLSKVPTATVGEIKNALFSSVDPITGLTQAGSPVTVKYGRVNAYSALLALTGQAPSPSATPAWTPAPTSTPTPTLTPTSTPTSAPTATPMPTPTSTTQTLTGSINRKNSSRSFAVSLPAGTADARLSFAKCGTLSLSLQGGGSTLATTSGPSIVVLDQATGGGSFSYSVYGTGQCSFTLTVTVTSP